MQSTYRQSEVERSKLHASYRAAWQRFSVEVQHWQILQREEQKDPAKLGRAETAAYAAEAQYRQARNAWADYLLECPCREQETLLIGSR
jgi:hypothetical protein